MTLISSGTPAGPDISSAPINHFGAAIVSSPGADSCSLCHNPSTPPLEEQTRDLCLQCHAGVAAKDSKLFKHSIVPNDKYPALTCEGCHKLHSAAARPVLAQSEIDLCSACHKTAREYKSHPVVGVFGAGADLKGTDGKPLTCASHCHDVHGADYDNLCRLEPGRELCVSCHKEFD